MILQHNRRTVPQLNTTSTADISFILLVFFLIMTSMDTDKGLTRMLPPINDENRQEATDIENRNVMSLQLTAADGLTINGKQEDISRLRQKVMTFVGTTADRQQHIITLEIDRRASYEAYFNIQNEIMAAYHALRDSYAIKTYGHSYDTCSPEQRDAVRSYYPQRITETTIGSEEEGGGK